jgi:hypothetical protein
MLSAPVEIPRTTAIPLIAFRIVDRITHPSSEKSLVGVSSLGGGWVADRECLS